MVWCPILALMFRVVTDATCSIGSSAVVFLTSISFSSRLTTIPGWAGTRQDPSPAYTAVSAAEHDWLPGAGKTRIDTGIGPSDTAYYMRPDAMRSQRAPGVPANDDVQLPGAARHLPSERKRELM
jgi:hypothetical protein